MPTPETPKTIFHYTHSKALKEILEHNTLWVSDARFLNDSTELVYAINKAVDRLREHASKENDELKRSLLSAVADQLNDWKVSTVYVACFCENGDLLSQWRAYGADQGYAIGFDFEKLKQHYGDGSIIQIEYGDEKVPDEIEKLCADLTVKADSVSPDSEASAVVRRSIMPILAKFKNPGFSEEREWRIMRDPKGEDEIKLRPSNIALVPYYELPFTPDMVTDIRVGPGESRVFRKSGINKLKEVFERYKHVNVECSEIPVRV
ncbi:DUF2971 domain-containing protein [Saccharopolyspora sp. NPDC002376]